MNRNTISSVDSPASEQPRRSVEEMVEEKRDRLDRLFGWWYKFTMPPRSVAIASMSERQAYRRARMISTVGIILLIPQIIDVWMIFSVNSIVIIFAHVLAFPIIVAMIVANRFGRPTLAGCITVFGCEILLIITIISHLQLNMVGIECYGLFVFAELLSISLLPIRFVFIFAVLDSVFIILDYLYQPKSPFLIMDVGSNGLIVVAIGVSLQVLVAGISSMWVFTASAASKRANRAELMAKVESLVAEQHATADQEKQELEESIQQLVQAHVDASNGQLVSRIPYPPAKVLWPIVGVLNSLWMRRYDALRTENELQRLKQSISSYNELLLKAMQVPNQPLPSIRTGTDIDLLIISLQSIQKSWQHSSETN